MKHCIHDSANYRLEVVVTNHPITGPNVEFFSTWPKANHPDPHRMLALSLPPESLGRLASVLSAAAYSGEQAKIVTPLLCHPEKRVDAAYPHLIVRIYSAVYQREFIEIRKGPPEAYIGRKKSYVQHPAPYFNGSISEECKDLLLQTTAEAVERLKFRMCIVWAVDSCTFVEPGHQFDHSSEPPSGGINNIRPIGPKRSPAD